MPNLWGWQMLLGQFRKRSGEGLAICHQDKKSFRIDGGSCGDDDDCNHDDDDEDEDDSKSKN